MLRNLALALLILACPLSLGLADDKKPVADDETGLVKVEIKGKLDQKDGRGFVQAKNPVFNDTFPVYLLRTEDKNRKLDEHIESLKGQVVIVRGVLRFSPGGPELAIPINDESQIQKAKKDAAKGDADPLSSYPRGAASSARPADEALAKHNQWVGECLKQIKTVKPGMTRKDLLNLFEPAGGRYSRTLRSYSYKPCPYFKISVTFESVGAGDAEQIGDKIVKVSTPYLEDPGME